MRTAGSLPSNDEQMVFEEDKDHYNPSRVDEPDLTINALHCLVATKVNAACYSWAHVKWWVKTC